MKAMGTSKETAEKILVQIQQIADARIRSMMGGYIVYVDDKVIGQINNDQLFIKVTPFGESFAAELEKEPPYPGAKPAFVVPQAKINDENWLHDFLSGTVVQL
jgi:TfoX/Sxy family transcriptional regulator of competence genes